MPGSMFRDMEKLKAAFTADGALASRRLLLQR
jgi:hypothetical protein